MAPSSRHEPREPGAPFGPRILEMARRWWQRVWEAAKTSWFKYVDVTGRFGVTISIPKTKAMTTGVDDSVEWLLTDCPDKQQQLLPWLVQPRRQPCAGRWGL